MKEFKGTPGPWFIKPVPDCTLEGAVNVIQTHNNNGLGFHIAYASGWIDDKETKAEADANARIIASAPELLSVLQGVIQVADRDTDEFIAARAAVAKALGESQ